MTPIRTLTEAERMDALFRAVISVPKSEVDKRDAEWKKEQDQKRGDKPAPGRKKAASSKP